MGSNTTGKIALLNNRNYIGIEKTSNYKIGKLMAVSNTDSEIGDISKNTENESVSQFFHILKPPLP